MRASEVSASCLLLDPLNRGPVAFIEMYDLLSSLCELLDVSWSSALPRIEEERLALHHTAIFFFDPAPYIDVFAPTV